MASEERPVSLEHMPEEVQMYMAALQPHHGHPFVRDHFHQVTHLSFVVPGRGQADFFALEFRVGQDAALIWSDGMGNWGAGRWLTLSQPNADITFPPSHLSLDYFQGAQANPTVLAAVELLAASVQAKQNASADRKCPTDLALRGGVNAMVVFLQANPMADDDAIVRYLSDCGVAKARATKLVQFLPIAFTRFLYRDKGVQFAPNYVVLGNDGQPLAQRLIADEPAFRAAWDYCEETKTVSEDYFVNIAARSGGYLAIQDVLRQGSNLADIATGPPFMSE
jgi:hypothetical protein